MQGERRERMLVAGGGGRSSGGSDIGLFVWAKRGRSCSTETGMAISRAPLWRQKMAKARTRPRAGHR